MFMRLRILLRDITTKLPTLYGERCFFIVKLPLVMF